MAGALKKILKSDIKKLCYCCQENPSGILLWSQQGDIEVYGQMLQDCFCIEFPSNKGDVICVDCVDQLQSAVRFKQQVTDALNKQMCVTLDDDDGDIGCDDFSEQFIEFEEIAVDVKEDTGLKVKKEPASKKLIVNANDFIKLENQKYQCLKCKKVLDDYVLTLEHMNTIHYNSKKTTKLQLQCNDCDETFPSKYKLEKHILWAHKNCKTRKPVVSKKVPQTKTKVKKESPNVKKSPAANRKTRQPKTYTCDKCAEIFNDTKVFSLHYRSHREKANQLLEKIKQECEGKPIKKPKLNPEDFTRVDKNTFKCNHCNKSYKDKQSLMKHVNRHHRGILPNVCDTCDKTFSTLIRLNEHKTKDHNIDLRHICNACDKVFYSAITLNRHLDAFHKLGQEKKCPHCEYTTYYSLKDHMSKHGSAKSLKCPYCPKAFNRPDTYKFHVRIHTGDKRKVCKICGERFVQRASLKYHMLKHHRYDMGQAETSPSETDVAVESIPSGD